MDAVIVEHTPRIEALAVRFAKPGARGRNGVEFDDLVQEGRIAVWQAVSRRIRPSDKHIRDRMLDYVKWLGRHGAADYGTMLPLDDYESVSRRGEEGERSEQNDAVLREVPGD